MRVAVDEAEPVVAGAVRRAAVRLGAEPVAVGEAADVRVDTGRPSDSPGPSVAAVVHAADVRAAADHVSVAGWWGGLGSLLAAAAVEDAEDPCDAHVAYGLLATRRALARVPGSWRRDAWRVMTEEGRARVDGATVPEPFAEGRRLAWFPAPVGPAHAIAVPGLERLAPLAVPTVRTWTAARSLSAEVLQALGRVDPTGAVGRRIAARLDRPPAADGDTTQLRWALVVEVRQADGGIVRSWANGTDPVAATGAMLAAAALRLAAHGDVATNEGRPASLLDLGDVQRQLDALADLGVLRWQLGRPTPSQR